MSKLESERKSRTASSDDDDETLLNGSANSLASTKPPPLGDESPCARRRRPTLLPDVTSSSSSSSSVVFRTRFSDLSDSLHRERETKREAERRRWNRIDDDDDDNDDDDDDDDDDGGDNVSSAKGLTPTQANKILVEMAKLNNELSSVVTNLRARQEESDHIHDLLIERAERAAQRIMFLQNRIASLEQELRENDDELQHLRICLKATEIQMPPHPDKELQRCIATFKHDYHTLRRKRATRPVLDSPPTVGSRSSF